MHEYYSVPKRITSNVKIVERDNGDKLLMSIMVFHINEW